MSFMSFLGDSTTAVTGLEPICRVRYEVRFEYECPVCFGLFNLKELCQAGIDDFIPPDPLPLGAKVRHKGKGDDTFWQGTVTSSQVVNADAATGGHRHVRWVEVTYGGGSGQNFPIKKGMEERDLAWELVPE